MPQLLRSIRPMFKTDKWRICRDDVVYILSGPDKGKTGKVLEVFKDTRFPRVIVESRNMRKKKVRTGPGDDDYFVVTMEAPLHYSQVQVADPDTGRPTRVIFMFTPEGKRVRARKVPHPTVNDIIPTPPEDPDPRAGLVGSKDTPVEVARRGGYLPAAGFPFRIRSLERIWAGLHPDAPASPSPPPAAVSPAAPTRADGGQGSEGGGGGAAGVGAGAGGGDGGGDGSRSPASASSSVPGAAGGLRGFCTAAAAGPVTVAARLEEEREEEEEAAGGAGATARMQLPPPGTSFAVSGLRERLCGGQAGSRARRPWGLGPGVGDVGWH